MHMGKIKTWGFCLCERHDMERNARVEGKKNSCLGLQGDFDESSGEGNPDVCNGLCFNLMKSFFKQISPMVCWFWLNQQEGKHKIHWLSRDMLLM